MLRDATLAAEQAGFGAHGCYDHLAGRSLDGDHMLEAFTLLGALAASTSRIELGTLVANVANRQPAVLAVAAASVDAIGGRRVLLGIGAGTAADGTKWAAEMHAVGQAVGHAPGRPPRPRRTRPSMCSTRCGRSDRRDELATFPLVAHRPLVVIGLNSVAAGRARRPPGRRHQRGVGPSAPRRAVRRRRSPPAATAPGSASRRGPGGTTACSIPDTHSDGRWTRAGSTGWCWSSSGPWSRPGRRRRAGTVRVMDDDVIASIGALVDEEHRLHAKAGPGEPLTEDDEARLRDLEVRLDQCWDLLRQRRARREYGLDPDAASVRRATSSSTTSNSGSPHRGCTWLVWSSPTNPSGRAVAAAATAPKEQPTPESLRRSGPDGRGNAGKQCGPPGPGSPTGKARQRRRVKLSGTDDSAGNRHLDAHPEPSR